MASVYAAIRKDSSCYYYYSAACGPSVDQPRSQSKSIDAVYGCSRSVALDEAQYLVR